MNQPLVSIIIPSYKNLDKIERAINSAVNQTYKNIEIIVVDDNGKGNSFQLETEKIVLAIDDDRIRYVVNDKNSERSFSRNNGALHSNGEYLAFLDNDDEFYPKKIESQLEELQKHDMSYAICYSNYIRDREGKIVCYNAEIREGNLIYDALCRNLFVHAGSNLLIKREAFEKVNGFNESLNINEDIDFLVRLLKTYKICYSSELGLIVYLHGKNTLNYISETEKYIRTEKQIIEELSETEKKRFYNLIGLQLIRCAAFNDIKLIKQIKKQYNVSSSAIIKYLFYLVKRARKKQAYSFRF